MISPTTSCPYRCRLGELTSWAQLHHQHNWNSCRFPADISAPIRNDTHSFGELFCHLQLGRPTSHWKKRLSSFTRTWGVLPHLIFQCPPPAGCSVWFKKGICLRKAFLNGNHILCVPPTWILMENHMMKTHNPQCTWSAGTPWDDPLMQALELVQ